MNILKSGSRILVQKTKTSQSAESEKTGLPPEAGLQWGVAGGTHEHVWDVEGAAGPGVAGEGLGVEV